MPRRRFRLTRLELKRQRDSLERFERFLPTLKLKQQQLQMSLLDVGAAQQRVRRELDQARRTFEPYRSVLADRAGLDVRTAARPAEVRTGKENIAGVNVPVFRDVVFPQVRYSLFATPPWVDRALADLRDINRRQAELDVLNERRKLLQRELTKIIQRVNLFEKVMIPRAQEAIRVIRIHLGDEQTAAVARAKIAKAKIAESAQNHYQPDRPVTAGHRER